METPRILVIDDDPDILVILKDNLELDGYGVDTASNGKEALEMFEAKSPGLVILDLSLPDMDGIQICRSLRKKSDVSIIMLTARDGVPDKVLGLESGADDYIVKPFDYLELAARIKARLRRRSGFIDRNEVLELGEIKIDTATRMVWKNGHDVTLTQLEFNLLALLARNANKAMDRKAIRHVLWPEDDLYRDSRAIDVHILHLRAKLEANPSQPTYIKTIQGVGYMLSVPT